MVKLFQKRQKQKPVNKFFTKIEKYFNIYTFLIKNIKYLFSKTIFIDFIITTHSHTLISKAILRAFLENKTMIL